MDYFDKGSSLSLPKVREAYKTYMKKIAKYLGGGPDSDEQMMKVFEFETKVAMVSSGLSMTNVV